MSAELKSLSAAIDCVLERRSITECATRNAARITEGFDPIYAPDLTSGLDALIADTERRIQPYRRARAIAEAINRPDLEAEIRHAIHDHDDCHVGYLVRTAK